MTKKVVGYIRVSTEEQASSGVSLDAQADRIRAWSKAHGAEIETIYCDEGLSGKRLDNRTGAQLAISKACDEQAVLVVYSISRLSRSVADLLQIAEILGKRGAEFVSLTEAIDTTGAAGRMIFGVLAVLAQFERELIGERTKTALAHKKANGEVYGQVPFGMRREVDRLVEDPAQQRTLRELIRLRVEGLSYERIARRLSRRGHATGTGASRWDARTVQRIYKRVLGDREVTG